jgi:hypothetical protein
MVYLGDDVEELLNEAEATPVIPKRIKIIGKNGEIEATPADNLPDEQYDITLNRNIPYDEGSVDFPQDEDEAEEE